MVVDTAVKGHFFRSRWARKILARKGGRVRSRNLLITDDIEAFEPFQNLGARMANAMHIVLA
jgi:hypothetical protein